MFFTPFLISYFLFIIVNSYNINKVRNNIFPYAKCIYQNVITTEGKRVVLKSAQKYNTFTIEHFPSKTETETERSKDGFFFKSDKTFSQFHIHSFLVEQLKKNNIHVPSVIQSDLLEYYNNNFEKLKNIIIAAENGIGKTLSYIIFILNHILKQPKMKSTFVLIFQYNNLLSKQCYDIVKSLSRSVKVKTTNLKKGDLLNLSGSFILISSPVRFVTYMKENKEVVENFFNHLNFFIIDEVDVMFDKPYMKYISIVYEEIHKRNTGNIISLITSSTLCNKGKKSIYNNIMKYITNAVIIKTDFFHNIHPFINYHFVNLKIYNIKTKIDAIKHIISNEDHKKVLIFCNTVKSCNTVCSLLKSHFDNIFSFNSSLKKVDQFEILELFKNSENPILVTTDIIHRGIDIKNITHLFHFDAPSNIIVYTHR